MEIAQTTLDCIDHAILSEDERREFIHTAFDIDCINEDSRDMDELVEQVKREQGKICTCAACEKLRGKYESSLSEYL